MAHTGGPHPIMSTKSGPKSTCQKNCFQAEKHTTLTDTSKYFLVLVFEVMGRDTNTDVGNSIPVTHIRKQKFMHS